MFDADDTAGGTAVEYADQFLDGAVAKIDGVFGAGYAKANPTLVGAYISACSTNLSTFIQSALAMSRFDFEDDQPLDD